MNKVTMKLTITPDVLAMEMARHGLKEIVRLADEDPFAFSSNDAQKIAQETLDAVNELEAREPIYGS